MKKILFATAIVVCAQTLFAQDIPLLDGRGHVSSISMDPVSGQMLVRMTLLTDDGWRLKSNEKVVLSPKICGTSGDTISLPPIELRGHSSYIYYLRDKSDASQSAHVYNASKSPDIKYTAMVEYKDWMENSELVLVDERCSCTQPLASAGESLLAKKEYVAPKPLPELEYAYLNPPFEETKRRLEIGNANILFPVNNSTINKNLGNNAAELDKIMNTINTLKSDKDLVITGVLIKGYASPEGSYINNSSLAKNRTDAIARMVKDELPNGVNISTDFEAEDWGGLREYVLASSFVDKEAILSLIDSDLEPDPKEWKIKSTHPDTYSKLLSECYPSLRRTEYQVKFDVKQFDVEEARTLVKTAPQKLSLDEMYSVAKTLPVGSEEYNEIYETAVRMFPNDPIANLNAANSALMRNDLVSAEKYLSKAGDSGEAITARGILAMKKGDLDKAKQLTAKAAQMGVEAAKNNLKVILTANR